MAPRGVPPPSDATEVKNSDENCGVQAIRAVETVSTKSVENLPSAGVSWLLSKDIKELKMVEIWNEPGPFATQMLTPEDEGLLIVNGYPKLDLQADKSLVSRMAYIYGQGREELNLRFIEQIMFILPIDKGLALFEQLEKAQQQSSTSLTTERSGKDPWILLRSGTALYQSVLNDVFGKFALAIQPNAPDHYHLAHIRVLKSNVPADPARGRYDAIQFVYVDL